MSEQPIQQKRYTAINGLRAFSAIGIIIMHVLANGKYALDGYFYNRVIASLADLVFLFMIVSGFSMCCGYFEKISQNKISIGKFYSKRYAKIWPFFATMCLLELLVSPSLNALYDVFANLTMCFGLLNADITVIGVGWFLGVVFLFYLMFPFFCYLIETKKRAWFSFAVAVLLNLLSEYHYGVERKNLSFCAVFFLAGGLLYLYRETLMKLSEKYRWQTLILCALFTVAYFVLGAHVPLMVVQFSLYVIYAMGSHRPLLDNRFTHFLSGISLEVYLSHMVIFRILEKLRLTVIFGNGILSYITTCILTVTGAIVFSVIMQKLLTMIEQRRYKKKA